MIKKSGTLKVEKKNWTFQISQPITHTQIIIDYSGPN